MLTREFRVGHLHGFIYETMQILNLEIRGEDLHGFGLQLQAEAPNLHGFIQATVQIQTPFLLGIAQIRPRFSASRNRANSAPIFGF